MAGSIPYIKVGPVRVPERSVRLGLVLLPIWVFGLGDNLRFVSNNTVAGAREANGFVKGRDFLQFYVAGTLATEQRWRDLYDVPTLTYHVARIVPAAAGEVPAPVYGPQVSLFFAPLSGLPYIQARWCWFLLSLAAYVAGALLVMKSAAPLNGFRVVAWITLLCNPALAMVLATGQTGAFAMLMWALAATAAAAGRPLLSGVCLGLLIYKPPLLLGVLAPLVLLKWWRVLAGVAVSAGLQCALAAVASGIDAWYYYGKSLLQVSSYYYLTDTIPHQKQSLLGFFQIMFGAGVVASLLALIGAAVVLAVWLARRPQAVRPEVVAMLTITAVLLSPHFYVYDLVVLTPSLLIVGDRLAQAADTRYARTVAIAGYGVLLAPYSGALASVSRIQLSTIALVALLLLLQHQWHLPGRDHGQQPRGLAD